MFENRLAILLAGLTFLLILLGGIVHATGSGLACPDWPLCYGSLLPEMRGQVAIEHTHRLVASLVGLLTLFLSILLWKKAGQLRKLGLAAVALVIIQGLLGGITVLYKLPDLVSTAHLGTSMVFFSVLVVIVMKTFGSSGRVATGRPFETVLFGRSSKGCRSTGPTLLKITIVLLFCQILLGALVRHTESGLICPEIPLCYGALWPGGWSGRLHMLHRILGVIVTGSILYLPFRLWNQVPRRFHLLLSLAPFLTLLQIGVGIATVETQLGLIPVTAHLGIAALLVATMTLIALTPKIQTTRKPLFTWRSFLDLVALTKPRITALVLATTAAGIWIAPQIPPLLQILETLLGTVLLVGAANTLNMYLERDTDALMQRTQRRPLPAKRLSPKAALGFGILLAGVGIVVLTLQTNFLTASLGLLALLNYVFLYTPMKKKSSVALLIGGLSGATPPLMGWTAATGSVSLPGLVLFFILYLWQVPHFLAIALFRSDEFERAGIKVLPVERGSDVTRHCMLRYLAGLLAVSLYPLLLGMVESSYLWAAAGLGIPFLVWSLLGLRRQASPQWAKTFFLASLVYLPLLVLSLCLTHLP